MIFVDEKRVITDTDTDYETIMVEVSLCEYRSLVEENTRLRYENERLENENRCLRDMR